MEHVGKNVPLAERNAENAMEKGDIKHRNATDARELGIGQTDRTRNAMASAMEPELFPLFVVISRKNRRDPDTVGI